MKDLDRPYVASNWPGRGWWVHYPSGKAWVHCDSWDDAIAYALGWWKA